MRSNGTFLFHRLFAGCERAPCARISKQRFGVECSDALAFDGSFDSLKLSCRCPQQNFARPSVKDSRQKTATSPGCGHLLPGVLDSWASSCLLCPVLCWIGLTRVLMTSSMTTLVRNDVIKRHRIVPSDDGVMMSQGHHYVQMMSLMTSIYDVIMTLSAPI